MFIFISEQCIITFFFPVCIALAIVDKLFDYLTVIRNDWQVILMKSHVFTALNVADVLNYTDLAINLNTCFFLNIG